MNATQAKKLLGQLRRLAREQLDVHSLQETYSTPLLDLLMTVPFETEDGIEILLERTRRATSATQLKLAIEKHMWQTKGHGSCWENDLELWKVVDPAVKYPHAEVPPKEEFMAACAAYHAGLCPKTP